MTSNPYFDRETATLLAQYHHVCEDVRQHNRLLWQIPSLVVLINSTLVVVVFTLMLEYGASLVAREAVLCLGSVLIVTMSFVLLRRRYFESMGISSLSKLEEILNVRHVQRTPFPVKYDRLRPGEEMYPKGLLCELNPRSIWRDGIGGSTLFFFTMIFFAVVIFFLMAYIIVLPDTEKLPSCDEKTYAWILFSIAILITIIIPIPYIIKRWKNKIERRMQLKAK